MKKETAEAKLNALFGLTEKVADVKAKSSGKVVGVSEQEIQTFREAQGLEYFLQAPALFTSKICPHCKEPFLVSRKYVSYCSYTCIRESLAKLGIRWSKGGDLEELANDSQVYNGNEPLWITRSNLERAYEILGNLLERLSDSDTPIQLQPRPEDQYQQAPVFTSTSENNDSSWSDLFPTTQSKSSGRGKSTSKKNAVKRVISFDT